MSSLSLRDQLQASQAASEAVEYPFVRRDKQVRARILDEFDMHELMIETVYPNATPTKRMVTRDYFDNNFWKGVD